MQCSDYQWHYLGYIWAILTSTVDAAVSVTNNGINTASVGLTWLW